MQNYAKSMSFKDYPKSGLIKSGGFKPFHHKNGTFHFIKSEIFYKSMMFYSDFTPWRRAFSRKSPKGSTPLKKKKVLDFTCTLCTP